LRQVTPTYRRSSGREKEREREKERRGGAEEGKKESDNETTAAVEDSRRFEALRNKVCSRPAMLDV